MRAGLYTPLGWVLLAANQLVLGWTFLQVLERYTGLEAAKRGGGGTVRRPALELPCFPVHRG